MTESYLANADVWTVLDLIAMEFKSDPTSVQCFDLRLVARTIELAHQGRPASEVFHRHITDENVAAHQALDTFGVPKVSTDNITLGLRDRILRLGRRP